MVTADTSDRLNLTLQVIASGESELVGWLVFFGVTLIVGFALTQIVYRLFLHGAAKRIVEDRRELNTIRAENAGRAEAASLLCEGRRRDIELLEGEAQ